METQKTICIVAPSLRGGGIERALTTLASHFVQRGYRVVYIACRSGQHFYTLDSRVIFREPNFSHTTSPVKKMVSYFSTVLFVREQLKNYHPDTVLSFGDIINPIALLANMGLKYPVYISDRISPKQQLSFFKRLVKRVTYPQATGVIAQTQQAAEYKRKVFGNGLNLVVIPNSLRSIDDRTEEKKDWIVGIGRLSHEKGFDRLIEAFSKIKECEEWRLVLAGDGPERQILERQVSMLGLGERVQFLGMVKDVDTLLAKSKIFVIPSRCEGFPNALCEAMASPLPCVCFDSVPTENLITHGVDGIVVKDGDIEILAKEIRCLMDDVDLREKLAEKAKAIRRRLDKEVIGDRFLEFIFNKDGAE